MLYKIVSFFKRIFSVLLAGLFSVSGNGGKTDERERPDPNAVTSYSVEAADYLLTADTANEIHDISDLLFGVFFEDINFAADGGLYAEMIANRSFEFTQLARGDQLYGYSAVGGAEAEVRINDTANCLNENNTNYLVLKNSSGAPAGIANRGFMEGMVIKEGARYDFSVYAKALDGYGGKVTVRLLAGDTVAAEGKIASITDSWQKYELTLTSSVSASQDVSAAVLIGNGSAAFDMISLFPEDTFNNRKNGLRADLCEALQALEPKFVRFPGGCVIEGYDADTEYSWKDSVGVGRDGEPLLWNGVYGDVAARKQGTNIWTDLGTTDDPWPGFMSYGLGFYEFFLLCEDLGASPVPVLKCGLACQMRGRGGVDMDSPEFARYVQDMLDLVEFCRGGADSKWGAVRASMGHPEKFDIKYICVGNENELEDYYLRYQAFRDAFDAAAAEQPELYDGIELIYSAGAADAIHGGNYIKSYEYAKEHISGDDALAFAGAIDQHYYNDPVWFLQNADYYDENNYTRDVASMTDTGYGGAIPVFLGEYAARSNTMKAALAEAAYMTGLERNGDIVRMAAYAPLFGNATASHWSPDLIWLNNSTVAPSANYYVQKLFMNNTGSALVDSQLLFAGVEQKELKGRVGVGTWYTEASFDNVKVVDNKTGKTLISDDFTLPGFPVRWENANGGDFKIRNGKLVHVGTDMNYSDIGDAAYFGLDDDMSDYTYTVEATKLDGEEGFLIPFAVQDKENNYFWNLGGWQNTVSCLQCVSDGIKTGQIIKTARPFTAETGRTYNLKVVVSGTKIKCYVDDELYINYDSAKPAEAEAYQVVSRGADGDLIVKLVNVTGSDRTFAMNLSGVTKNAAVSCSQLSGESEEDENILGQAEKCGVAEYDLTIPGGKFNYTVPKYSVTVLRFS